MRTRVYSAAACAFVSVILFAQGCVTTAISVPSSEIAPSAELPTITPTPTPSKPLELRAPQKGPKRPKFTKRPRPRPNRPHHHPQGCTNTELIKNGDFNKNVRGWEFIPGSPAQFFWVKDSKKRPSHSGAGQGYLFLNRGLSQSFLITTIPAVEYGNSIAVSVWMRYEEPADVSGCTIYFNDNDGAEITVELTPKWKKYEFEAAGTGRPKQLQFNTRCESELPISIYLDDVSAKSCVPKNPNPECQVLPKADNFLVNPGFECPNGVTAWSSGSLYGEGNETIAQLSGKTGNPTHSGSGMAGLLLDASQLPYPGSGVAIWQDGINDDMSRAFLKASFWLSADSKLNNVTGCLLSVGTGTGYYLIDVDISYLTTKWTKFEIEDIVPTPYDTFQISISQCQSSPQPLIYLDDVYFGIDKDAPPAPPTTTNEPTATPTAGPCTSTPTLADPGFEVGDTSNWLFFNGSPNFDVMFSVDSTSAYGPPHSGSSVGVIDLPTTGGFVQILQQLDGLCSGQSYTATAWYYIPTGYDASQCTFSVGVFARSDPISPAGAGVWTKVEVVFFASLDATSIYPYVYIGVNCASTNGMMVLIDDISFGPPPPCSITPTISDGGFESGDISLWNAGFVEGDETFTITSAKPHTGTKSAVLTFPSTSNGAGFGRDFDSCVGGKYTFRFWYFVPKQYKGTYCSVVASVYYTGEYISNEITTYDAWVEVKLEFTSGGTGNHVDFGVSCLNQLQKVVVYIDDVGIAKR